MKEIRQVVASYSLPVICLALVVITLAVYFQVGNHPFLDFDDNVYVTDNPHVATGLTGKNIAWAFTSIDAGNWHPITWLSHMADVTFYGMNPRGHHLTNLAIHVATSLLILLLLLRCTRLIWQSSFVAVMFALHPLHVESVAWVAERKDVLSAFFWFLTLLLYAEFSVKRKAALYLLCFSSFLLGLMSKPMLVTLPLVMLLMDFWPLGLYRTREPERGLHRLPQKMSSLVAEKIPFLVCSLLSGVITIYAQQKGGATSSLDAVPFVLRIENAFVSYAKYIVKTLWPSDLAVLYPYSSSLPPWQVIGSISALMLVTATAIGVKRRFPFLMVGWFWFLVTLVPVIGLIQVGSQSMADRYSYIPLAGLFIIVAWGVPALTQRCKRQKMVLVLVASAVITASAGLTWRQLGYWQDGISLYRHALEVGSGSYLVHNNLGTAFAERGDLDAAIEQYRRAIRISPDNFNAHGNLGLALIGKGELEAAIMECRAALRLSPDNLNSHYNLGVALAAKGELAAAIQEYREAVRINPDTPKVHNTLGLALLNMGDLDAAIREFRNVLRLNPQDIDGHCNLGVVFARENDLDAALQEFQCVLRISPNDTYARNNLERVLAQKQAVKVGSPR